MILFIDDLSQLLVCPRSVLLNLLSFKYQCNFICQQPFSPLVPYYIMFSASFHETQFIVLHRIFSYLLDEFSLSFTFPSKISICHLYISFVVFEYFCLCFVVNTVTRYYYSRMNILELHQLLCH